MFTTKRQCINCFFLQEIEPDNYNKIVERVEGINTAGKLGRDEFFITELPFMFKDWKEYRDYLLENIIQDEFKGIFKRRFDQMDKHLENSIDINNNDYEKMYRVQIGMIITNDYMGTKQNNNRVTPRKSEHGRLKSERRMEKWAI